MKAQKELPLEIPPTKKEQRKKDYAELAKILGFKPKMDGLITALTSEIHIDVIALDRKLQTPDGVSLEQHIINKHGQHASELAKSLL